jgi:hypothetical protein
LANKVFDTLGSVITVPLVTTSEIGAKLPLAKEPPFGSITTRYELAVAETIVKLFWTVEAGRYVPFPA